MRLTAIGITCGIGSLLIGARSAGFKILGNVEWRDYYHATDEEGRNTFTDNFPGAPFPHTREQMTEEEFRIFSNPHLALGHPECGQFSQLSGANKDRLAKAMDPGDIPLFVELVGKLKPQFFVMDDLPKSFLAYPMQKYAEGLPGYDLFPEWVSNWGYGNIQKGRNRMFMLGALRGSGWVFRPGEQEHTLTVADVIGDLARPSVRGNMPNHDPHAQEADCFRALNLYEYRRKNSWAAVAEYFRDKKGGHTLQYVRQDGSKVNRIGFLKGHWDGPSHVLTGGNSALHHLRCEPYTLRERARIQGFPDDFVFYGTILNKRGEWCHDDNLHMVRQTGKAMPVQFAEYVSRQVAAHIKGEEFHSLGRRLLPPNEHVDAAKLWYCSNVGYSDQAKACSQCWLAAGCALKPSSTPLKSTLTSRSPGAAPNETTRSPAVILTRKSEQKAKKLMKSVSSSPVSRYPQTVIEEF